MTAESIPLVAPFRGLRYADDQTLDACLAPPYDVIDGTARERFAAHDHNVVHFILPSGDDDRYERAAATLGGWQDAGVVALDAEPAVYVVQQRFTTPDGAEHARTGVIAAVAAEPFEGGRVRPHERTHAGPKRDRLALMEASHTIFESLFMLSRDADGALAARLLAVTETPPTATARLEGVEIAMWAVAGPEGEAIAAAAGRADLYIADGHHRYETAVSFAADRQGAARVPALIVSLQDPGLVVLATHRVLDGAPIPEEAIESLRDVFNIRQIADRHAAADELDGLLDRGTACVLVLPDATLALLLKPGASLGDVPFANEPAVASLDVARIDALVVDRLSAATGGTSVRYSASADEVVEAVDRGHAMAGVLLQPTRVDQVLAVADAHAFMPPKSTYFIPKVPSGLVAMTYA
jgi:uncharacterized protein (DUF1015 family)